MNDAPLVKLAAAQYVRGMGSGAILYLQEMQELATSLSDAEFHPGMVRHKRRGARDAARREAGSEPASAASRASCARSAQFENQGKIPLLTGAGRKMRFGLFGGASARRGVPAAESARGYHEFVEYHVEAEALGFHGSFVTEHHFTKIGQISATLTLLTWIAARTTTLRLGTAIIVLPWHNPVLLAEQAATLDLLVRRQARFRRRQGLPQQRIRRLRDAARGGREPLRGGARGDCQGVCLGRAVLASRTLLAFRQYRRRAAAGAAAAPAAVDGREQRRVRSASAPGAASTCCSTSSPRRN